MRNKQFKNSVIYKFSKLFEKYTGYRITPAKFPITSEDLQILEVVDKRTMTGKIRLANLLEAVKYLNQKSISGDFVECGVWRGGSVMAMALKSKATNNTNRKIWLYDTFQGMTEPSEKDIMIGSKNHAEKLMEEAGPINTTIKSFQDGILAYASREDVEIGLNETRYPEENFILIQGDVRSTLISIKIPEQIALLRLDTDFYDSTLIALEILWPRLVSGGILILDDYDSWGGAKFAVDEYFEGNP